MLEGRRPFTVLYVEDNPADRMLVSEFFDCTRRNCLIITVNDGAEALEYLQGEGRYDHALVPDLILLDLNLPKVDGREVLRRIKQHPRLKHIPTIVFSTSTNEQDIQATLEDHANCYVVKPRDLDDFAQVMDRIQTFWLETTQLGS